jgi:hypothetical protein
VPHHPVDRDGHADAGLIVRGGAEEAGGDALEDTHRRDATVEVPEDDGVGDVERGEGEAADEGTSPEA